MSHHSASSSALSAKQEFLDLGVIERRRSIEGYLRKQSPSVLKPWQKRYFFVSTKTLSYGKSPTSPRIATIPIVWITNIAINPAFNLEWSFAVQSKMENDGDDRECCDREFKLRGDSATQTHVWVSKLRSLIARNSVFDISGISFDKKKWWKTNAADVQFAAKHADRDKPFFVLSQLVDDLRALNVDTALQTADFFESTSLISVMCDLTNDEFESYVKDLPTLQKLPMRRLRNDGMFVESCEQMSLRDWRTIRQTLSNRNGNRDNRSAELTEEVNVATQKVGEKVFAVCNQAAAKTMRVIEIGHDAAEKFGAVAESAKSIQTGEADGVIGLAASVGDVDDDNALLTAVGVVAEFIAPVAAVLKLMVTVSYFWSCLIS
jgi:hypothetical protein